MIDLGRYSRSMFGVAVVATAAAGCSRGAPEANAHADHAMASAASTSSSDVASIPAGASTVAERLAKSPRHEEFVTIRTGPSDSVRAWVVYPQRSTKAPVVVVVHEIFGLSTWVRGVADQLAADGFIAIAPDLLTGQVAPMPGTDTVASDAATAAVGSLRSEDVPRQIAAVGQYGMALPAAQQRYRV